MENSVSAESMMSNLVSLLMEFINFSDKKEDVIPRSYHALKIMDNMYQMWIKCSTMSVIDKNMLISACSNYFPLDEEHTMIVLTLISLMQNVPPRRPHDPILLIRDDFIKGLTLPRKNLLKTTYDTIPVEYKSYAVKHVIGNVVKNL